MHSRIVSKYANNHWFVSLRKTLDLKLLQTIKNKQQACQMVRVNLQNSENIINNIIKANQRKQFFIVINEYMNKLGFFPNEKLRDVLYNIE